VLQQAPWAGRLVVVAWGGCWVCWRMCAGSHVYRCTGAWGCSCMRGCLQSCLSEPVQSTAAKTPPPPPPPLLTRRSMRRALPPHTPHASTETSQHLPLPSSALPSEQQLPSASSSLQQMPSCSPESPGGGRAAAGGVHTRGTAQHPASRPVNTASGWSKLGRHCALQAAPRLTLLMAPSQAAATSQNCPCQPAWQAQPLWVQRPCP